MFKPFESAGDVTGAMSHPVLALPTGIAGFCQSFIEWTTPVIQYLILVGSFIIVINSVFRILFPKKVKRKEEDANNI